MWDLLQEIKSICSYNYYCIVDLHKLKIDFYRSQILLELNPY